MKKALFAVLILIGLSFGNAYACPDISGSYIRNSDKLVMKIQQNGCRVNGTAPNSGFEHYIKGFWRYSPYAEDYYLDYTVIRVNRSNGCITKMEGSLGQKNQGSQIKTRILSTDGNCELPTNFTETSIWDKQ